MGLSPIRVTLLSSFAVRLMSVQQRIFFCVNLCFLSENFNNIFTFITALKLETHLEKRELRNIKVPVRVWVIVEKNIKQKVFVTIVRWWFTNHELSIELGSCSLFIENFQFPNYQLSVELRFLDIFVWRFGRLFVDLLLKWIIYGKNKGKGKSLY